MINEPMNPESNIEQEATAYRQEEYDYSPLAAEVDAEVEQEESQALDAQTQSVIGGMPPGAPDETQYDYAGGVTDGVSFASEEGGVNLPNEHIQPDTTTMGGYDMATGDRALSGPPDDDGIIQDGVDQIRESFSNTETGAPLEDVSGVAKVAYGTLDSGADFDEYLRSLPGSVSEEQAQDAWEVASRAKIQDMYNSGELDEEFNNMEPGPDVEFSQALHEDDFLTHQGWMDDAQVVSEYMQGEDYSGSPEDLHQWMLQQMSQLNAPVYGGVNVARWAFAPDEVQQAVYRVFSTYSQTETTAAQFGRGLGYNLIDPTSWASMGLGAKIASKFSKTALAKVLTPALVAGAAEGAVYSSLDDFYRQSIPVMAGHQEGFDPGQGAEAAGLGAVGGAAIGKAASKIPDAVKYAHELGVKAKGTLGSPWISRKTR